MIRARPRGLLLAAASLAGVAAASASPPALRGQAVPDEAVAAADSLSTPAEAADWLAYTAPDSVLPWLRSLEERARGVHVAVLTEVPDPEGAPAEVAVAFLSRADSAAVPAADAAPEAAPEAAPDSAADAAGRPLRILIVGSQHGDERAGCEAALVLARELAAGPLRPLLARLEVAVVPVANPVGMRRGTRRDAAGIDLNRDHAELLSEPARALAALRSRWRPDLLLDLHEMAPSAYGIQIGPPTHPNVDPDLASLARFGMLPWVAHRLARADVRFHEYVATHPDPHAERPPGTESEQEADPEVFASQAPIDASNARNAFALDGRVALLVETSSDGTVEGLRERTARLALTVRALLEVAADRADEILAATDRASRVPIGTPLALAADYVADPRQPALTWLRPWPNGGTVTTRIERWRPRVVVTDSLPVPAGWVLGADESALVERLRLHGFRVNRVERPVRLRVQSYAPGGRDLEGPPQERTVEPGAWTVSADQAGARLLFTLLEPGSDDGWLSWAPPGAAGAPEIRRIAPP